MGQDYARILGPLAFATVIIRGVLHQAGVESTLKIATVTLVLFAGFGYVLGAIGEMTVRDSVLSQFQESLAAKPETEGEGTA
ncbi:MAG TPA: hypothetical protein EYG57_01740 [Planctomycetes bacterium]|nr:hypothetical protein [Planctomycetaceae bacterium]HIM28259.1 hypothetical protein [Planctomycetota bacterium]